MNDHCVQCINLGLQYLSTAELFVNVGQSVTGCINLALLMENFINDRKTIEFIFCIIYIDDEILKKQMSNTEEL